MDQAVSRYLREVRKRIRCPHSLKMKFLSQLEDEIHLFCEDFGSVSYSALEKRFGKPEDVAKDFLSELGESALIRSDGTLFRLNCAALVSVIAAALVIVGLSVSLYFKQRQVLDGYYIESITYDDQPTYPVTGPTYAVRTDITEDIVEISE